MARGIPSTSSQRSEPSGVSQSRNAAAVIRNGSWFAALIPARAFHAKRLPLSSRAHRAGCMAATAAAAARLAAARIERWTFWRSALAHLAGHLVHLCQKIGCNRQRDLLLSTTNDPPCIPHPVPCHECIDVLAALPDARTSIDRHFIAFSVILILTASLKALKRGRQAPRTPWDRAGRVLPWTGRDPRRSQTPCASGLECRAT